MRLCFFAKKNPKQVVLFSLCAFVLKLQRVSETCKQGCQLIRTKLYMKHTNGTGTHHAQWSVLGSLSSFLFLPLFNLSKWELNVLSKQLLKLFTYSLIWWSNKPLAVGYLTQRMLSQNVCQSVLERVFTSCLVVITALAPEAQMSYPEFHLSNIFW